MNLLHSWLWVLCFIDPRLFKYELWMARLEGCIETRNISLFKQYFQEFIKDKRSIPQEQLMDFFMEKKYTLATAPFFHLLYENTRTLPVTVGLLINAMYLHDEKMQDILLRNYEEATLTLAQDLNRMEKKSDRDRRTKTRQWHQAYRLLNLGAIQEARELVDPSYVNPSYVKKEMEFPKSRSRRLERGGSDKVSIAYNKYHNPYW